MGLKGSKLLDKAEAGRTDRSEADALGRLSRAEDEFMERTRWLDMIQIIKFLLPQEDYRT